MRLTALLAATALALAVPAALAQVPPARPAADFARDGSRHASETLVFTGVKAGDKVGDFVMGGGYFTRLFAEKVGSSGRVYAFQPAEFIAVKPSYGTDQKTVASAYPNVVAVTSPFDAPAFPEGLDLIFTAQNYHDLHLRFAAADTAAKADAALFHALKPGGTLVVIDHVAAAGSGLRDCDTLHRIDPATMRAELEAAGFKFAGEADFLRNPADPHTQIVFDPAIRGHTDQVVYRFTKPA